MVDITTCIYSDTFPSVDCGLRLAAISQILARLPTIMEDEEAWEAYCDNKAVLKALHEFQCVAMEDAAADAILTPPVSPKKLDKSPRSAEKKGWTQDRPSGG
jgi:histone acetyltransferase HTATIP